jgi:lipopolysaccharide exporter
MLARRVFLASAMLSFSRLFARVLDLIAALVVARFLSPADFGLVTLATASLMILRAITELPIGEALQRSEELTPADIDTAFTLSALRGLLVTLLVAAAAWPMAAIYADQRLMPLMLALSIAPLAMGLKSPAMVRFAREVNFAPTTVIDVVAKLAAFAIALAVAIASQSYWALAVALIVPPLIATPASYLAAPYRPRFSLANTRAIVSFAGWVTLARFITTANGEVDRFFIGGVLGKAALGFFAMGRSVATTASWAVGTPLMQAMMPGFARLQGDKERLAGAYLKGQAMLVAGVMPLGVALGLLADPIVAVALGPQWAPAASVLAVFAPVGALATITMPVHALVLALGCPKQLLLRDVVMFALGIPAVVLGAWSFGLMGAAYARLLTGIVLTVLNLAIVDKLIGLPILRQIANCWRSALSAGAMAGVILLLGPLIQVRGGDMLHQVLALLLVTSGGMATYLAAHSLLWLLAGKPHGPERFLGESARHALGRLAARRTTERAA